MKLSSQIIIIKCIIFVFSDTLKIYDKKSISCILVQSRSFGDFLRLQTLYTKHLDSSYLHALSCAAANRLNISINQILLLNLHLHLKMFKISCSFFLPISDFLFVATCRWLVRRIVEFSAEAWACGLPLIRGGSACSCLRGSWICALTPFSHPCHQRRVHHHHHRLVSSQSISWEIQGLHIREFCLHKKKHQKHSYLADGKNNPGYWDKSKLCHYGKCDILLWLCGRCPLIIRSRSDVSMCGRQGVRHLLPSTNFQRTRLPNHHNNHDHHGDQWLSSSSKSSPLWQWYYDVISSSVH